MIAMRVVYEITFPGHSAKRYVGSTSRSLKVRMKDHRAALVRGGHENSHLQRAFDKYGSPMVFTCVEEVSAEDDLIVREQHWIDKYDFKEDLYNMNPAAGSTLGRRHTPEARARMSVAKRNMSDETKARMSAAKTGVKRSPEARAILSAAKLKMTDETKRKMSAAHTGKKKSAETRKRMSEAQTKARAERRAARGLPPMTPKQRLRADQMKAYNAKKRAEKSKKENAK